GDARLEQRVAGTAVPRGVCIEEVDAAEAVDLEVDEAGDGEAAPVGRGDSDGGDPAVDDFDVAGEEHAVDERRLDSEPLAHRASLEVVRPLVNTNCGESFGRGLVSLRCGLYHRRMAGITLEHVTK